MGLEWAHTTIGEQVTLQRGFDITKKEQRDGSVPVVSSGGINSWHDTAAVSGSGVVLGRKGVVGSVYFINEDFWPHDTTLWVKDFKGNFPKFVYYFFRWQVPWLASLDVGSANPTLNRNHVHPQEVRWPPRSEQEAIAHILGTLDDKIELNRQMNATLEAMAQALFKSWFVDFDPVIDNALAAGNPIPEPLQPRAATRQTLGDQRKPLPEAVQQQFPSRFVFTEEMGWIPEGWTITPLDQIADYRNGLALQKFRPEDGEDSLPVVKIAQLKKGWADGEERASSKIKPDYIIDDGDVVFSWSGSLIVDVWCGGKAALNQHLFKVTSTVHPKWFYLEYTKHHLEEFQRIAADKAVTMGHIKRRHLSEAMCVLPPLPLVERCSPLMEGMLSRYIGSSVESRSLETLRDTLLPNLLSGELRVPAAEKQVAEVV